MAGFRKDEERARDIVYGQEVGWATLEDRRLTGIDNIHASSAEILTESASAVGLSVEELKHVMKDDIEAYKRTYHLATAEGISYAEAKSIIEKGVQEGLELQDAISRYHNSKAPRAAYPKEPRPKVRTGNKSIYENRHKKRSTAGWRERAAKMATFYVAQSKISSADRSNPSDLEENPFDINP